jgi:hypothetical protein
MESFGLLVLSPLVLLLCFGIPGFALGAYFPGYLF